MDDWIRKNLKKIYTRSDDYLVILLVDWWLMKIENLTLKRLVPDETFSPYIYSNLMEKKRRRRSTRWKYYYLAEIDKLFKLKINLKKLRSKLTKLRVKLFFFFFFKIPHFCFIMFVNIYIFLKLYL